MKVERQAGPVGLSVELPDGLSQEVIDTLRVSVTFHARNLSEQQVRAAVAAFGGPEVFDAINPDTDIPALSVSEDVMRPGAGRTTVYLLIPDGREHASRSPFAAALAAEQFEARLATEGGAP